MRMRIRAVQRAPYQRLALSRSAPALFSRTRCRPQRAVSRRPLMACGQGASSRYTHLGASMPDRVAPAACRIGAWSSATPTPRHAVASVTSPAKVQDRTEVELNSASWFQSGNDRRSAASRLGAHRSWPARRPARRPQRPGSRRCGRQFCANTADHNSLVPKSPNNLKVAAKRREVPPQRRYLVVVKILLAFKSGNVRLVDLRSSRNIDLGLPRSLAQGSHREMHPSLGSKATTEHPHRRHLGLTSPLHRMIHGFAPDS